jgi:F0F1-type ATP synthase membrane subunit c/vacuolar-type H+-ATPase subunit K
MQLMLIIAIALHVASSVFWAGTTFTLARTDGARGETLFKPQMGSATVAVLSGAWLWSLAHRGQFGPTEKVLAIGILCAFIAAGVQGAIGGRAVRQLAHQELAEEPARAKIAFAQRIAAALLLVTVLCMAISRYV